MKIKNLLDDTKSTSESIPQVTEVPEEKFEMNVDYIQPWSNMIVRVKIPDKIFEELLKMYEYTMKDWKSFGSQLVGQINEEPEVTKEIQAKFPDWINFCLQGAVNFVNAQTRQNMFAEPEKWEQFCADEVLSRITTMWFVNQKPGEYNPVHIHTNCKVSSVVYLKTPKKQIRDRKKHYSSDGRITFMNNSGTDFNFANSQASFTPVAGDMYLFGALQNHMVWPYRSTDPEDLRTSLSFNADVTLKSSLEMQEKERKQFMKQMKESENDKSADVSNVNKSG